MKKLLLILSILILNSNIALATNNLINADWWKTATLDQVKSEIASGADVNTVGTDKTPRGTLRTNVTPLMFALKYGNPSVEVIETLIKAGSNVNAKESTVGFTVLMYAAPYIKNPEIIKVLIKNGLDVNAKDKDGWTALMYAAKFNQNSEISKTLIEAGANKTTYIDGQAIHIIVLAMKGSNNAVVNMLTQDYENEDYEDKVTFEANFEGCLATEQIKYDVESSMSGERKMEAFASQMLNPLGAAMKQPQRSNDCKCIFEIAKLYLGETEYNNVMNAFKQGKYGSSKKALRKAIPAAFMQCF